MNKKTLMVIAGVIVVIIAVLCIKGLGNKKENTGDTNNTTNSSTNISYTLEEIMNKLYAGIDEDDLPRLENTKVTYDNVGYYLGREDIEYVEALASEPIMTSVAHSVVLVRLDEKSDAEEVAKKIKQTADGAKWICVQVEEKNVRVETKGNLVLLVMTDDFADEIVSNFKSL